MQFPVRKTAHRAISHIQLLYMQLHAINENQSIVSVKHASKGKDYFCLECQEIVRVRAGPHRHKHFYHLARNISCRLNGKGMVHLQVQEHIKNLLPKGQGFLEYPFPAVNRIADVAWLQKQLVFEVQCSPISPEEIEQRIQDYRSQGLTVIWVLHDNRYNKYRLSAAELYLRDHFLYFTNINANGEGIIYDQFDIIHRSLRQYTLSPPLKVDPSHPKQICPDFPPLQNIFNLKVIHQRFLKGLYFSGDLFDLLHHSAEALTISSKIEKAEKAYATNISTVLQTKSIYRRVIQLFARTYRLFFQILLERACR